MKINLIKDYISNLLKEKDIINEIDIKEEIEKFVFSNKKFRDMNIIEKSNLIKEASDLIIGYNKIQPLIEDDDISEIMINSNIVFYEKKGKMYKWKITLSEKESLLIIQKICEKSNRSINSLQPINDASLEGGIRTNTILYPVAVDGNVITIRKFPKNPITSNYLLQNEFYNKKVLLFLKLLIKAKYNIFICGGTGSGKTTLLNVLSEFINNNERVITIEDSIELSINHIENIVRLEARKANSEGKGEVTIEQLIKASLRMRPDRIIVGEVRGKEALDMLQAMNTGHDGSLSTGHSNSCDDMITRLETMILSNKEIPISAIRNQIKNAIDIFVFVLRIKEKRVLYEIAEVIKDKKENITLNCIYKYDLKNKCIKGVNEFVNTTKIESYTYGKNKN